MRFSISLPKRLGLFALVTVLCYILTGVLVGIVTVAFGVTPPVLRILSVIQDIMLFMLPALITAMLITRLPATFLLLDRKPSLRMSLSGILLLAVSVPAMNSVIAWNEAIALPAAFEAPLRAAEEQARQMIETMLGGYDAGSLVMGLLLVGILAPLAEELFFRGCLLRLFTTGRMNTHVAIWLTAVIFSLLHGQVYGFVPRMLLGGIFGYAAVWSRSLWVPVLMHAFNNSTYVVSRYVTHGAEDIIDGNLLVNLVSVLLAATVVRVMYRSRVTESDATREAKG